MRRLILCLVVACVVAAIPASVASAQSDRGVMCVLHAELAAENETTDPPSTSIAKGHTQIKVRNDGTIEFKTRINNKGAEDFVAAHIHVAPVGVAGPIVVPLPLPVTSARHIKHNGVATPNLPPEPTTTPEALCQTPIDFYVNYHTEEFQAGAIRGQLR